MLLQALLAQLRTELCIDISTHQKFMTELQEAKRNNTLHWWVGCSGG